MQNEEANVNYFIQHPKLFQFITKEIVRDPKFICKIPQFSDEVQMHLYNQIQSCSIEDESLILQLLLTFIVHFPAVKQAKAGNGWISICLVNSEHEATIIGYDSH